MSYGNGRTLALSYDGRQRLSKWDVAGLLGWEYDYDALNEKTGRVSYARSIYDRTLDRAYEYDHVGRLTYSTTGSNARAMAGMGDAPGHDGPYSQSYSYDERGNLTQRQGWGGWNASSSYPFDAKNRNTLLSYDTAGNVTSDGSQLSYDATGQQTRAVYAAAGGWDIHQGYDGDRQRVKKVEGGQATFYLRSTVLGGQVVGEYNQTGAWTRGYVYDGTGNLLAMQAGGVQWVHQDPVTKSQRVTDRWGNFVAAIDVDPWGGETWRTQNGSTLSRKYTTYERDGNGRDQAMQRSYHAWFSRFDQPDPFDGSYDLTNPQTLNRYAYVGNDPVNFTDPSGLDWDEDAFAELDASFTNIPGSRGGGGGGGGGFGGYGSSFSFSSNSFASSLDEQIYEQRLYNAWGGYGFLTNAQRDQQQGQNFSIYYGYNADGSLWTYFSISGGTTTASLAWHQRGALGTVGDFSRGVANSVTFGITEGIHESRGEPRPDTAASTAGEGAGVVLSMVLPGGQLRGLGAVGKGVLTGFTKHGINQAISRDGVGVATKAIFNAVQNPIKVVGQSGGRTMYVGQHATVVLNSQGRVVTTWARSSAGWRIRP